MLNSATVGPPQHSTMASPIEADAPSPEQVDTYLNTGNLPANDNCCLHGGERRSVNTIETFSLLAEADPAVPDSQGNTPLCLAAQAGNQAQVQHQIDRGADVHHTNLDGDNALTLAATGGHLTFIKWLDSHYPQSLDYQNYYAETALTLAARHGHQPLVQWLVSRSASVVHLNDQLKDALAEAVANGHLELAQWLAQNTDLSRVYPDGNNLFLHAVRAGRQDIAQWLEDSGVDSRQINESGDSALTLAARHGHHQLLPWLLAKNAAGIRQICRNGDSPLLIAAHHGHSETVKLLVQHGADIRLVNYAGSSVLTLAAASNESLALWLCDSDTDIHHIDCSGNNAFTLAAQSGFFQLMQTLERLSINIHQVNHNNDNAFTLVARQGNLPWCQWLAGKGINIHQVNRLGHNAVTLAALAGSQPMLEWLCAKEVDLQQMPETIEYNNGFSYPASLLSCGFNAAILAASVGHFTQAQWLMGRGLSIHQCDCSGRNAVIQAVEMGQLEAVQWFTAQGIVPDGFLPGLPDCLKKWQPSTMDLAVRFGHLHILQWLHQNSGSLGDQNVGGNLLILAARRGNLPMVQWFWRQGADINHVSSIGASALSVAICCGHLHLSQWLADRGPKDTPVINGNRALILAASSGRSAIFRWLIRSERLDDQQANALLMSALRSGRRSLAVWLCLNACNSISRPDNEDRNALMLAAESGFLWLTQWLSERTADVNQASTNGLTAVMLAAANGHLPVVQWLCLEKNANLHAHGRVDALHLAVIGGHTETVRWLIGRGMVLNLDYFKEHPLRLISNRNNVGLLQFFLRQQFSPQFFLTATQDAARNADVPALACCLSAGVSRDDSCFCAAADGGSLAALEFLCHGSEGDVAKARRTFLESAAQSGNLHIIQWFWRRSGLSKDEKNCCLFAAANNAHFHVVKWLHRHGADIVVKNEWGYDSIVSLMRDGNIPMLEWFCQRGVDLHQVEKDGKGALSLAIEAFEPHVAMWLFHRGLRLTKKDIEHAFSSHRKLVLVTIFKMTSRIRRANLFHTLNLKHKLWLLDALQLYKGSKDQRMIDSNSEDLSEEEANVSFVRFNQYNDKTLQHKSLVVLSSFIGEQFSTLEQRFNTVDHLPIPIICKDNLRELIGINLE